VCEQVVGAFDDPEALARLAEGCDVVTYEFENVPVASAEMLAGRAPVYPPPRALEVAQDRLNERRLFRKLGVPIPEFEVIDSLADLRSAAQTMTLPALLKARRLGYDGKGQFLLCDPAECADAWDAIGRAPALLDTFIDFERELSVIAARSTTGETAFYPLSENIHRGGILRVSRSPAPEITPALQQQAERHARAILDELGYVGVLAVEFFQVGTGEDATLIANEIAPRVHNSGHWTIEGARTSQFENHLRAVLGLPLGPTGAAGHSAMINLIGDIPRREAVLAVPGAALHLYGKSPRPGRKVGHVTLSADSREDVDRLFERFTRIIA